MALDDFSLDQIEIFSGCKAPVELVKIEGQLQVGRPAQLTPGSSQLAQLAANVAVNIPAIGGYRVHIEAGSGSARADRMLPFRMIRAT